MNLSAVIRDLKHCLKCLGMLHVQTIQKRCLELRDKLSGPAKELSEVNTPFDDMIFGADMEKSVNKIIQANKISRKISSPTKQCFSPFVARGCGRHGGSRGSHFRHNPPHNQQQNYQYGYQQNPWHQNNPTPSNYTQPPPPQQQIMHNPPKQRGRGRGHGNQPNLHQSN